MRARGPPKRLIFMAREVFSDSGERLINISVAETSRGGGKDRIIIGGWLLGGPVEGWLIEGRWVHLIEIEAKVTPERTQRVNALLRTSENVNFSIVFRSTSQVSFTFF